jgi:hypothetical protein
MVSPLTGSCLCGAVRFECRSVPFVALFCHCRNCQKSHSAPYAAMVGVPPGSIRLLAGEPRRHETIADSGATVFRDFCDRCGTHLFSGRTAYPDAKSIKIAALDDPEVVAPVAHIWTESRIKWASIEDGLPRFPRHAELSELMRIWRERHEGPA